MVETQTIQTSPTKRPLERINPVNKKWELFLNALYNEAKWNITEAYIRTYKSKNRQIASFNASRLVSNERFKEYHNRYLTEVVGINKENILKFWSDKLMNAKKEDNQLRSSENIAEYLGMLKGTAQQQAIQVNIGFKSN